MAGDLSTLATRLRKRADELPNSVNEVKKKVVRTVINDLAYVTPVDESTAISNWQTSLTRPETPIAAHFLGEGGSTYSASARETVDRAERVLATVKPGQAVYIGNVLPYIGLLNEGSSKQEPAGFAERAVLLGRKIVQTVRFLK